MKTCHLSAALLVSSLLAAPPAFTQTTLAKLRLIQGGGPSMQMPCGLPFNANPAGDPNCKQRTQNLGPPSREAANEAAGRPK
jgi:hypothetical protein